jgi:uncharacterized protein YgfB (UPF0149 family)
MSGEVSYAQVEEWIGEQALAQHPSELHGLITGWICAGTKWNAEDRLATLSDWLSAELDNGAVRLLEVLYEETAAGLVDEEFAFRLLLPGDDAPLNDRTLAVSQWCSGFLAGFGMTGRYQDGELSKDVSEVFTDLDRISSFSGEVPEDDENEADLVEIGEYVRMSALLVFTECAHKAVH